SRRLAPRPERGLIGRAVNQGASVTADDDEAAALSTSDENIEDPVAVEDQQVRGEVPVQGLPLAGMLDAEERLRRAAVRLETLESYLARHYRNMKEDYHGSVVERYSFFSHAVVEPLISDGAPHRKLIAALQDILDHEGEERARAAVRRGLSRGNKRRHKAICTALNRVCIHLDICRLLHLTLPRTST
ncbi:hypothetical protein FOZ62_016267, partial [Perkinsus olseni]